MKCRHCGTPLVHTFLDLGFAPPSNAYLTAEDLTRPEKYYPLRVKVCEECWLVQTEDYAQADEFFSSTYAYFSSTSTSWLAHAAQYATDITRRLGLNQNSYVIEVASNDGYLLKNFVAAGIPCLGIEPTASTAAVAEQIGIPVMREFFGESLAQTLAARGQQADLIVGNNVFAHVPDINDFARGLKAALKPAGVVTLEFPHLMQLIQDNLFDIVYHEHFSYLSLTAVERIFNAVGLKVFDIEKCLTQGGSYRIYGCHATDTRPISQNVNDVTLEESTFGLRTLGTYLHFQEKANKVKNDLLEFLIQQKKAGKKVVAYGAAAKGNTLLNFAGAKPDLLPFVADAATAKQGHFMPGSHIEIVTPEALSASRPDYVLILPWNIASEVIAQNASLSAAGARFVTALPQLKIL